MKLEKVTAAVAKEFDLDYDGLPNVPISSLRPPVLDARQALCLLARRHTSLSLPELSEALKLSHVVILHGEARAKTRLAEDKQFRQAVDRIERRLAEPEDVDTAELRKVVSQLSQIATKLLHTAKDLKLVLEAQRPKKCCKNIKYKTQETLRKGKHL